MDETILQANEQFKQMLYQEAFLSKLALIILCCISVGLLLFTLYYKYKRDWECNYYLLLCAAVLEWGLCSLLAVLAQTPAIAEAWGTLRFIGAVLVPALLCLHIRQQVSYKEPNPLAAILLFAVPAFLIFVVCRNLFFPEAAAFPDAPDATTWLTLIFYLYAIVALIRSYLLCFNVFYQMPRHMRRGTHYLIISISSVAILLAFTALWNGQFSEAFPRNETLDILLPIVAPVAFIVMLFPVYNALHLAPSANVIATSREFVFGSLSTTILVLSKKDQILDWNKKDWDAESALPKPLYREPFDVYRRRALEQSDNRLSPHNENIITVISGGKEMNYMITTHEIGNRKRYFGRLVEISEITPIYSILRYFEDIAHVDQLTGLYNRNAYMGVIPRILTPGNMPLLILVGDVNKLKQVNDVHGHLLGDQLLTAVSDIIKRAAPRDAFPARVGGDEFVILVPGGSEKLALQIIGRIEDMCMEKAYPVFGNPSISWGYAVMASTAQSYNEVFSQADQMMYKLKKEHFQFRSSGLVPERARPAASPRQAEQKPKPQPRQAGQRPYEPQPRQAEQRPPAPQQERTRQGMSRTQRNSGNY